MYFYLMYISIARYEELSLNILLGSNYILVAF
jgi:hypothetical protein